MSTGDIIKKLRIERGYSQAQLALKLHINRSTVAHWEANSRIPNYNTLMELADIFGVTADYILGNRAHTDTDVNLSRLMKYIRERLNYKIEDLEDGWKTQAQIEALENPALPIDYALFIDLCETYGVDAARIKSYAGARADFADINFDDVEQVGLDAIDLDSFKKEVKKLKIMTHKVPIYGAIPAGTPLEAIQDNIIDHIEVPSYLAQRKGLFALRIEGDSMNMIAGDGMVAVFESTDRLEDGELGAVYVNGYDATFKKFHRLNNMIILEPMSYNPEHEPIIIKDAEGVEVTAVGRLVTIAVPRDYVDRLK